MVKKNPGRPDLAGEGKSQEQIHERQAKALNPDTRKQKRASLFPLLVVNLALLDYSFSVTSCLQPYMLEWRDDALSLVARRSADIFLQDPRTPSDNTALMHDSHPWTHDLHVHPQDPGRRLDR